MAEQNLSYHPGTSEVVTIIGDRRPGVYLIVCLPTGEAYVGGSVCVTRRFQQHRYELRRGDHHSTRLQTAWDCHGESAFSFGYLVKCEESDVLRYEQHFIDVLKPEFNTEKLAGNSFGTKRTEAHKARLRGRPQSTGKKYTYAGELLTVAEISERSGMQQVTIRARLRKGIELERPKQLYRGS